MGRPARISTQARHQIVRLYAEGAKIEAIAAHFGITHSYVSRLGRKAGLPRRDGWADMAYLPGDPLTKVTLNLFTEDVDWLRRNYGIGWSAKVRAIVQNHVSDVKTYQVPDAQRN